ncbi:MAG TPA: NAD(P)/FAD-dependent oxidoreductase [Opitutus sp.]|nr:NAD(P)/FAD-dependent oxidoreductase [Opitutus sp.]
MNAWQAGSAAPAADARLDVLVIGAGQAGLAAGYFLQRAGVKFALIERNERVGDSWRRRYDSLRLFSPRSYDALPGAVMPGDPEGYPSKDEMAGYLEAYVQRFGLPVRAGEGVTRLERGEAGGFAAHTTARRTVAARAVIAAAGAFQRAVVPAFAGALAKDVEQFTAQTYRCPAQVKARRVVVIGAGATGRQIARELAPGRDVWLAGGRAQTVLPQRVLGRDNLWWLDRAGVVRADKQSVVGRLARARDAFPGAHLRTRALRRRGVRVVGRALGAVGRRFRFAGDAEEEFGAVVWAVGYRDDASWLRIEGAVGEHGEFLEKRGVSPAAGLFYVGRSWQNNRASALVCGVGDDAAKIVARVRRFLANEKRGA